MSICPSDCPYVRNNSAPTGRIFVKFRIMRMFRTSVDKIRVLLKPDKNNGYLYVLCAFMIIFRRILLRMRSILDQTL